MKSNNNLRFILHVSDFHLKDDRKDIEFAKKALKSLTTKLSSERIKINYLVHTGDIIDSSDLYLKVAEELKLEDYILNNNGEKTFDDKSFIKNESKKSKKAFNDCLVKFATQRFKAAEIVFKQFVYDLNLSFGHVVICCGNHDALRLLPISSDIATCKKNDKEEWEYFSNSESKLKFSLFYNFLDEIGAANSKKRLAGNESDYYCSIDDLNFLILNTNWDNPSNQKQGYFCTRCDEINEVINNIDVSKGKINIVLAHKPLYEICEQTRLSYQRYIQTSFMSNLRKYIGKNGIYFCGDKHTRSIIGTRFHDIPHYIGGEPLYKNPNKKSAKNVEYNLLEISNGKVEMERKIHLNCIGGSNKWNCYIRPQDKVTSDLFNLSKEYIVNDSFKILDVSNSNNPWDMICQKTYDFKKVQKNIRYKSINNLYRSICKYRDYGIYDNDLKDKDIFEVVCKRIKEHVGFSKSKNVLNIRGEYSSGKSIFLGLMYIYLLHQYSIGEIDFIPAYFNLENNELSTKISNSVSYFDAVKQTFFEYSESIQKIAYKEHQPICFIIDGLDEQDCWSYSTEDSIGRVLLNILSEIDNSWYIMSFSQHRLPCFKNTMPARKYNDKSDIMYFNPIDIGEYENDDSRFKDFVKAFLTLQKNADILSNETIEINNITPKVLNNTCEIISDFRRLTITPGFMFNHLEFILKATQKPQQSKKDFVNEVYNYYIDKQYEICLHELGYNFVEYAPAMAYLFSFKGYTYERFIELRSDNSFLNTLVFDSAFTYTDKIYKAFLFIKKNKDAREYLIALHYNRELRYYVEHPMKQIDSNSILYEFISRNIAVLIRKQWKDTNKFLIACDILLQRSDLPVCMQSVLIYCLFHLQMYSPIRDKLKLQLQNYGNEYLSIKDCSNWSINKNDSSVQLEQFINLSLKHSIEVFNKVNNHNSIELVSALFCNSEFKKYNRQFQMLYYEDLSIRGEETKRPLNPEIDIVFKGFDFHNSFYYLFSKLSSNYAYPLREFDMFTLWDLIYSRLNTPTLSESFSSSNLETFFYHEKFFDKAIMVITETLNIYQAYISNSEYIDRTSTVFNLFTCISNTLKAIENSANKKFKYNSIKKILDDYDNEINTIIN